MPRSTSDWKFAVSLFGALALVLSFARGASAAPTFVYVLNQINGGANQIYGYRIDASSGILSPLVGFPLASGGIGGAGSFSEHVAYGSGRLFVVNEGSPSLSVFNVDPVSGFLTAAAFSPIVLTGDPACVTVHPTGSPVIVGGNNGLSSFVLTSGTATAAAGSPFPTPAASPFSCRISSDGNYVYTGGNVGNTVAGVAVTAATGVLTALAGSPFNSGAANPVGYATDGSGRLFVSNFGTGVRAFTTSSGIPTAVAGNPFASGLSGGVAGVVHPSGFYMVADRSGNRVGVYQIAGSGAATTLTAVTGSPFATFSPFTNSLALTPGGRFLLAANGGTRSLTIFDVNSVTGALISFGTQPFNSNGTTGLITGLATAAGSGAAVVGDFDGDKKSDVTMFRPSTAGWYFLKSGANYTTSGAVVWGASTDAVVPGDYDGDGKTDPAVFRPSTGGWYFLKSSTNFTSSGAVTWGASTDTPVAGEYDGDGKTDPAVFRPSTGGWYFLKSSTNFTSSGAVTWGASTDVAVPGDYDGDGKIDPAVFRPSTGGWYFLKSSTNFTTSGAVVWGVSTDTPVPADYDGDGKTDPAIFRPSSGLWAILQSSTNYTTSIGVTWGIGGDTPILERP